MLVFAEGQAFAFTLPGMGGGAGEGTASDGALISPMPGRVIAVDARQGDKVAKGQKLVTLEAMKMEHSLTAPFDGIVAELNADEGAQVAEGREIGRESGRERVRQTVLISADAEQLKKKNNRNRKDQD